MFHQIIAGFSGVTAEEHHAGRSGSEDQGELVVCKLLVVVPEGIHVGQLEIKLAPCSGYGAEDAVGYVL